MWKNHGFTLLELILAIVLMGILAISGLPHFFNIAHDAKEKTRESTVLAIRQGIEHYHVGDLIDQGTGVGRFPAALDDAPDGVTACDPCFTEVIEGGLVSPLWYKGSDTVYIYNDNENPAITYTYDPTTGTFE